ncbi:MAG: 7-cyano-7-deazaguanine synthase QueC [Planctomycetota bacterium]|jgi:7-cyano-7-deazaguanine synthase
MSPSPRPSAVVLFSGGLDSSTILAIAIEEGFAPIPVSFLYGQNHAVEVEAARRVARSLGAPAPLELELPFGRIGGSSLLGDGPIPAEPPEGAGQGGIPSTYVPARNLTFLSLAVGIAEARGARDIFIGVNALDYSGYPDCRPAFIEAFRRAADAGTRDGSTAGDAADAGWWRIHTPLLELTKAQIVSRGHALGVDHSLTLSCYDPTPTGLACGRCDSCGLRRRGFEEAGLDDPTPYAE